ncbi:MAG: DNA mismatch repair endonuclease MutL [Clostridia bacterium]
MNDRKRIRVLPRNIVNRIAAGEIIERPASVVKELVENSLDAEASRIVIDIESGGVGHIAVGDDGVGIHPKDMLLTVQSHATSKLLSSDDLWSVSTLGFRGEALASIAAVSRLEIRSRARGMSEGAHLAAEGDRVEGVKPWMGPQGTRVEVSDLFFNTPVRRDQLANPGVETSHVATRVRELALANPTVSFRLTSADRELVFTSGTGDLLQTVAEVFDGDFAARLLPLDVEDNSIIGGFIGPPDLTRSRRDRQYFLLNGRAIMHPPFQAVLERAYEGFSPVGRHPVAIVTLNVRSDRVDVNVHPAKRRVRFHDERELAGRLYRRTQGALLSMKVSRWDIPRSGTDEAKPVAGDRGHVVAEEQMTYESLRSAPGEVRASSLYASLEPMGQVLDSYIVARGPGGLYLIDQHAACERLYYEAFLTAMEEDDPPAQKLASPLVLDLDPDSLRLWNEWGDVLGKSGFEVEGFGPDALVVRAVPIAAGEPVPARSLIEVLERLGQGSSTTTGVTRAAAAFASCRASVKAGQSLADSEICGLLQEMARLETPAVCPHGRPTIIHIGRGEIERLFRRNR